MDFKGFYHESKSRYAYATDLHTLQLRLRTGQDATDKVQVIVFDPFVWEKDSNDVYKVANPVTYTMTLEQSTGNYDWWFAQVEVPTKRAKYGFIVECEAGKYLYGTQGEIPISTTTKGESTEAKDTDDRLAFDFDNNPGEAIAFDISPLQGFCFSFPYILEDDLFKPPTWVADTVWYQIFPERYANSGNPSLKKGQLLPWGSEETVSNSQLYGGDIPGITSRLDEIQALGFTGIYLTPIFKSSTTHKYNTEDYYQIDPAFGNNELFAELVNEAKKRGIRIMIDLVFNHIGNTHPIWKNVERRGENSPYYHWFSHRPDGTYETFATVKAMPKWNTANPKARAYLMDIALHWAKNYAIDGFRLDVANEVSHDFWREFRKTVKAARPDMYILGEVWDDGMPWLYGDQFDSVMNYPLADAIWGYVSDKSDGTMLKNDISRCLVMYPRDRQQVLFNLIGTHDTGRIKTVANGRRERVKQAFTLLMTMPGSPMCFYGDEVGISGSGMDDARKCMIWEGHKRDLDLQSFVKKLIALRAAHKELRDHEVIWHKADASGVIYQKGQLLVALNGQDTDTELDLPTDWKGQNATDLLTGQETTFGETIRQSSYDVGLWLLQYKGAYALI